MNINTPSNEPKDNIAEKPKTGMSRSLLMADFTKKAMETGHTDEEVLKGLSDEELIMLRDKVVKPWIDCANAGQKQHDEMKELDPELPLARNSQKWHVLGNMKFFRYVMRSVLKNLFPTAEGLAMTSMPLPGDDQYVATKAINFLSQIEKEIARRKPDVQG